MEKIPVLLDTDIGSDIDDAVALAYLLRQPKCDLLGITTVTGEPEKRASIADAVCRLTDRTDIPIHVGVEAPFLIPAKQPRAPHAEALTEQWPHEKFAKTNTAIQFLRETIHANPNRITLLTIGPLTNIALLFALDPEIPALLKQLVMMGGRFTTRGGGGANNEWNIICDPHAAACVFAAPVPRLIAVGLDVTEKCRMSADESRKRFTEAGGALGFVGEMAEVWFRHTLEITFHDPLAAALIFEPTLCKMEAYRVEVELTGTRTLGQTLLSQENGTPHEIAVSVDSDAFFQHYFQTVARS